MPRQLFLELGQCNVRMSAETRPNHPDFIDACRYVVGKLGLSSETLRAWHRRIEVDVGPRSGNLSEVAEKDRQLRRENAESKRANHILKSPSVYFDK